MFHHTKRSDTWGDGNQSIGKRKESIGNKGFCFRVSPQVTPIWYSFWKRTPRGRKDLQMLVPAGCLHRKLHPCPGSLWVKETPSSPPLRDANLIIKLHKSVNYCFCLRSDDTCWNYSKRILKIKGAKGTMRSHKQAMGNWLQESCGTKTTHARASSIKRYGIWR